MVCSSVDQSAENLLESNAVGRNGIFDVEMDSGICGPSLISRPDEEMPTGTAPMEIPTVLSPAHSARRTRA